MVTFPCLVILFLAIIPNADFSTLDSLYNVDKLSIHFTLYDFTFKRDQIHFIKLQVFGFVSKAVCIGVSSHSFFPWLPYMVSCSRESWWREVFHLSMVRSVRGLCDRSVIEDLQKGEQGDGGLEHSENLAKNRNNDRRLKNPPPPTSILFPISLIQHFVIKYNSAILTSYFLRLSAWQTGAIEVILLAQTCGIQRKVQINSKP